MKWNVPLEVTTIFAAEREHDWNWSLTENHRETFLKLAECMRKFLSYFKESNSFCSIPQ